MSFNAFTIKINNFFNVQDVIALLEAFSRNKK
jgi:hypothetical protein